MKKKITHNLGIKILSLLVAILTWYIIITVIDPTTSRVIEGVKVSITNDKALKGFRYSVTENEIISVTVKGKKSVVDTVKAEDIYAEADLGKMMFTFSVPITIEFKRDSLNDLQIIKGNNEVMKVKLEKEKEQQFEIQTEIVGSVKENYYVSKSEITKAKGFESVTIKGPDTLMKQIDRVQMEVDVSDISGEVEREQDIVAVNEDGEVLDPSRQQLVYSFDKVKINIKPLMQKELEVKVQASGTPEKDYAIKGIECDVSTITVAGDASSLAASKTVVISVDVDGAKDSMKKEFKLSGLISGTVKLTSEEDVAKVNVSIEKMVTKKIDFYANEVKLVNQNSIMNYKYNGEKVLTVEIKGLNEKVKNVSVDNLSPYVDVKELKSGKTDVEIKIEHISGVTVVESPKLEMTVEEK